LHGRGGGVPVRIVGGAGLPEAANAGGAAECLVEGNDFGGSGLEGDFAKEVIGEAYRALAGGFQSSPSQGGGLDDYATRLEQAFDCA